jgi:hypothetical protein
VSDAVSPSVSDVVSPSAARRLKSPFSYIVINAVVTAAFIAIELPLIWANGVEGVRFWVAIAWIFGIMSSTFAFVRASRVVAGRPFVTTFLWSLLMGLALPIGWTTVFHIWGDPLTFILFWNVLGPLAMTVVYCGVLSAFPRTSRLNWMLGLLWSVLFFADAYLAISLKIYCCDWM